MSEDKARTKVPLNSPMNSNRNPSWRTQQLRTSQFKVPEAVWQPGNAILRRFGNGMLDYDYACGKIFEALDIAEGHGFLDEFEKAVLSLIAPGIENLGEPPNPMTMTKVRLSPDELMKLRILVAKKRGDIRNYRAGW